MEPPVVDGSALDGLVKGLRPGDHAAWAGCALEPLPLTVRVNPMRPDVAWTEAELIDLGATRLKWAGERSSVWRLPWSAKDRMGEPSERVAALHSTGRVTRQEAASMLPPLLLDPRPGQRILDMCAAPGSKATQLTELMRDRGVVVANEHQPKRLNLLSTNRTRLGLTSLVLTQHDGRHLPRVPAPGFDAAVVDVPCTGTATHRKAPDIWSGWQPQHGRSMHRLQLDIALRAARLVRPGGALVYATCSFDPVENEAVVVRLLAECPWLEVVPIDDGALPGLTLRPGLAEWPAVDDEGRPWEAPGLPGGPHWQEALRPPDDTVTLKALTGTRRLWPDDNDTGGFYVAILRQTDDSGQDPRARGLRDRPLPEGIVEVQRHVRPPDRHTLVPADAATRGRLEQDWGLPDGGAIGAWRRGQQVTIIPESTAGWLWASPRTDGKGGCFPGGHWQPLRVVDAGLPAFSSKADRLRPRAHALPALDRHLTPRSPAIPRWLAVAMVRGWAPSRRQLRLLCEELPDRTALEQVDDEPDDAHPPTDLPPAARLDAEVVLPRLEGAGGGLVWHLPLEGGGMLLPTWLGQRLTLMLPDDELAILARRLDIPVPAAVP